MLLTPWWKSPWYWLAMLAYTVAFVTLTALFGKEIWVMFVCAAVYVFVLAPLARDAQTEADWEVHPSKWDNILKDQK